MTEEYSSISCLPTVTRETSCQQSNQALALTGQSEEDQIQTARTIAPFFSKPVRAELV